MAEVLVVGKKISEMELVTNIVGDEKIPTGVVGDKAVTTGQLLTYLDNNGKVQWGRIEGDIANQTDLQNQFSQQLATLQNHIQDQDNPHNVTKEQVGLGLADNTADMDKPVSTAVQEALSLKADQTYVDDSLANKTHNSLLGRDADGAHPTSAILDASGVTQQQVNDLTGAPYRVKAGGYSIGERVVLGSGDIVKSTVAGNTVDPNVDMTGWVNVNSASQIVDASGLNQQEVNSLALTPNHFGAIGDNVYHKLSERYETLEDAQVDYPSAQSLNDSIDLVALEAFFEHCHNNFVTLANITLKAKINRPLDLGVGGRTDADFKTQVYYGNLELSAASDVELPHLMQINMRNTHFCGRIVLNGTGGVVKNRKVMCGLLIGDRGTDGSSGRVHINEVYCSGLKYTGIILLNDSIFPMIDKVYAGWCGSSAQSNYTDDASTHYANITTKLEDIAGDFGQRSKVAVDSLPPIVESNRFNVMAVFEGDDARPYRVTDINTTDSTISVYPLLDTTKTYTKVKYIYGGGLFWTGNNSGVGTFNHLQFIVCGVGFWGLSLYGGTINMLSTENCGAGYSLGKPYEAVMAYEIINGYFEANLWDYVQQWDVDYSVHNLRQSNNFKFNKMVNLQTYKYQNKLADPDRFFNSSFTVKGQVYRMSKTVQHWSGNANVDLSDPEAIHLKACWTNSTVSLSISDISKIDRFLSYSKTIMLTPRNSVSTGRIKISPPQGWKLNGGEVDAIITATNYMGNGAIINLDIDTTTKNINVRSDLFTALPVASVTYDPPSLTASGTVGDSVTTTVTLSGATVGSVVQAAFSQYHADIEIRAAVSAANTVTVKFKNTGAAAVDLASGTLTVKLI